MHKPVTRVTRRWKGRLVALLVLSMTANLLGQLPVLPANAGSYQSLKAQTERSVAGTDRAPGRRAAPADPATAAALKAPAVAPSWPAAGAALVDLAAVTSLGATQHHSVRAGALPVQVDLPAGNATFGDVPASVRVQVLDHVTAVGAHQQLLLRVGRGDASSRPGRVAVTVDDTTFRSAYGADYASRLRLVQLPECALTTPDAAGCQGAPLPSSNDVTSGTLTADVALPATTTSAATAQSAETQSAPALASTTATTLVAAAAAASGAAGDFTATKLAASSSWQAGGSSGDFSWNYSMRVPPSVGGPSPSVALAYSAQSVDGHNAASNNQPSWAGEGFDYNPGSVTRSYKPCADDMGGNANNTTKTGDECWATYNATLSLSGHAGELIRDDVTGGYRLKGDDGTRVELLTGASNGDNNGEYWRITTTDGTQYFFGLNRLTGWTSGKPTTNSAYTVPVFGNNPGEPCNATAFANSYCSQAWQWNLDYGRVPK